MWQPVGYQAERRQLAAARRAVFLDPPTRRNRVWQTDVSELESLAGGIWRMSGVVDYWAMQLDLAGMASNPDADHLGLVDRDRPASL